MDGVRERIARAGDEITAKPLHADRAMRTRGKFRPLMAAAVLVLALAVTGTAAGLHIHAGSRGGLGHPVPTPPLGPPDTNGVVTWDSTHHQLVLMGGLDPNQDRGFGVWIWDGRWRPQQPSTSPPHYSGSQVFLDMPPLHGAVLLGPFAPETDKSLLWDGHDWVPIAGPPFPTGSQSVAGTWDPARGRALVIVVPPESATAQTWEWDGVTWTRKADFGPYSISEGGKMAFDHRTSRPALTNIQVDEVGGRTLITREWDGSAWHQLAEMPIRPDQEIGAFGDDPATGQLLCIVVDPARGIGQGTSHTFVSRAGPWRAANPAHEPFLISWLGMATMDDGTVLLPADPHPYPNDHIHVFTWTGSDWVDLSH